MKVLILSNALSSDGGIQNFTKDLYSAIDSDPSFSCEIYFISGGSSKLKRLLSVFKPISTYKPDVVILPHIYLLPLVALYKYIYRFKIITCMHGIEIPLFSKKILSLFFANFSDRFFSVSSWTDSLATKHLKLEKNKISRQVNTFRESLFRVRSDGEIRLLRNKYKLGSHSKILLTVCRFDSSESYKGYDKIIDLIPEIISRNKNFIYLLVGTGDDLSRIHRKVEEYGIQKHVLFLGRVSDDELSELYSLSDVFAMPSSHEGFGIVFLEAMACGIPVLAGNVDGSIEPTLNGYLGKLVDPNDSTDILNGLLSLLNKNGPDLWFNKNSLRQKCISHFSFQNFKTSVKNNIGSLL